MRTLVGLHGGDVSARSEGPGLGSEFQVRLARNIQDVDRSAEVSSPLAEEGGARSAPEEGRPSDAAAPPRRALVVDDNRDAADTLAIMLSLLGMETRCIYDPLQVEDTVAEFAPELVFMDVGMPGRSGYEVARALRATFDGKRLVLVAVTGWGQPEDRMRTAQAGFDHHLVKPPELHAIRDICTQGAPAA